ncbi:MAG: sugar transferase [Mucilaginibacter sp.]|nr:sugar transferase [Mucilaginibacter sp.]
MVFYSQIFKRFFDLIFSLSLFILFFPFFLILSFLLTIANKNTPFFLQSRPGKNGHIFKLIKFKTMNDKKDENGNFLSDAQRITSMGSFIRKTSLDEIPQLLNVIKGDMSLVGPRPLLIEYLPLYNNIQKRRHEVRPGITGWAQVNGRNSISWEKKFEYDVYYVDHMSFCLDLKILILSAKKVFKAEGISLQGHATMPFFEKTK